MGKSAKWEAPPSYTATPAPSAYSAPAAANPQPHPTFNKNVKDSSGMVDASDGKGKTRVSYKAGMTCAIGCFCILPATA